MRGSRSAVRQRIRLTRKARWLEGLDEAIQAGRIGTSHAALIVRVADPDTLEAWIERSTRRTYKHLAEEVELADLVMRFSDDRASLEPPSEDDVKAWHRIQEDWLNGAQMKRFAAAVEVGSETEPAAASTGMLECAEGEPYWQRGEHIDEVEAALAAILRRWEEGAATQISEGRANDGGLEAEAAASAVRISGASANDGALAAEARANAVQISAASAMVDRKPDAEATAGAVPISGGFCERSAGATRAEVSAEAREPSAGLLRRVEKSARRRQRRRSGAMTSATFVARNDVVLFFRELEEVFARSGLPGTFVELLLADFWLTWGPAFEVGNKWKPIHDRDRHQCTCPVCFVRKSLANHHVRYRAHGGGDEMENQIIACDFCHLDGEHGGRLRVRGTAERPVWVLGRTPVLCVEGREKIELNDAQRSAPAA